MARVVHGNQGGSNGDDVTLLPSIVARVVVYYMAHRLTGHQSLKHHNINSIWFKCVTKICVKYQFELQEFHYHGDVQNTCYFIEKSIQLMSRKVEP